MKKYLLDTNIVSYLEDPNKDEFNKIISKLSTLWNNDTKHISILSIFEYQSSISLIKDTKLKEIIIAKKEELLKDLKVENLKLNQEIIFWELQKQYLAKTWSNTKAVKKHTVDLILASQCIDEDIIMVSNDNIFKIITEFRKDFKHENWIDWFSNT